MAFFISRLGLESLLDWLNQPSSQVIRIFILRLISSHPVYKIFFLFTLCHHPSQSKSGYKQFYAWSGYVLKFKKVFWIDFVYFMLGVGNWLKLLQFPLIESHLKSMSLFNYFWKMNGKQRNTMFPQISAGPP